MKRFYSLKPRLRYIATALILCVTAAGAAHAATVFIIQNNFGAQENGFRLVNTEPYDYQKLDQAPREIIITFSLPVETADSSIQITDLFGQSLTDGHVTSEGNRMVADLPALQPGKYKVKWKAQCRCAAQTQLDDIFRFTVR